MACAGWFTLGKERMSLASIRSNRTKLALAGLAIAGFTMRVWGIRYGLPYLYHPDEPLGAAVALNMLKMGDLNPHFFGYGSLFFYLNALAYIPYYLIGEIAGFFHTPADIPSLQQFVVGVGRTLMPSQIILGRLVSVALGVLCIPVVYWLGSRLSNRQVGLLAAALVALSPALVLHSQFITPNILATLMVLVTLATLLHLTPQSRWPSYVLVGMALGGAVASKYNAAMLGISYLVACLTLHGWAALRKFNTYLSPLVAALAFLAVTPYAVLDWPTFIKDTEFHLSYYTVTSHPGMEGNTLEFYVRYLLGQHGVFAFMGLLPVTSYIKTRNRNGLILASFALPYVLYVSTLRIRNDRTILIALPVLLIMAADFVHMVWQRMARSELFRFRRPAQAAWIAFVAIWLVYPAWQAVEQNIRSVTPDAREYSRRWIEASVPTGTRIAAEAYSPFIDPERYEVTYFSALILNSPEWYVEQGYDLLVLSSGAFARYYNMPERYPAEVAKYDALPARFSEIARFDQNGVIVRVLSVGRDHPR